MRNAARTISLTTIIIILMLLAGAARAQSLPSWAFGSGLGPWKANADLTGVKPVPAPRGGALEFEAAGSDGFLHVRDLDLPATPWQFVQLRLKADRGGDAQLFWSGALTGPNGGLTEKKSSHFTVIGDGQWHDYLILPGWQAERTIRQLRLDFYRGARFALGSIEVRSWGGAPPLTAPTSFAPGAPAGLQALSPGSPYLVAPPLRLPLTDERGWVVVKGRASAPREAAVLWSAEGSAELHRTPFTLRGDGAAHEYNFEMHDEPGWRGRLSLLGLEWPAGGKPGEFALDSLAVTSAPLGPPDVAFDYIGFENAINHPGRECRVVARALNRGAASTGAFSLTLSLPAGLRIAGGQATRPAPALAMGETADVVWPVVADRDGASTITVSAALSGPGAPPPASAALRFDPPLSLPKASYVPPPKPIETTVDVAMYYFPGWSTFDRWRPVQRVAPIRKPALGWYDEANPECVDWQIKWARENGVSVFLLDWYWSKGAQHLDHWLAAYKRARYRDQLKLAIMWANHNPPGSHSREDWRRVTQYWIDNAFALPGYYRVGGQPALFLWSPDRAREDMGGSAEFKAALQDSQALARKAGYPGIAFIAVNDNLTPSQTKRLADEGFVGTTSYHEFGKAPQMAPSRHEVDYKNLVATAPAAWEERNAAQNGLAYYPLIDTGWDARPWHGANTMVMSGRTPALFEKLLRAGRAFQEAHQKPLVILGPANEWGEGSYIEPNLEFGFQMYERVRAVFGKGDPASWPVNFGPADVGLGPYDLSETKVKPEWTFTQGPGGWRAMMRVRDFRAKGGQLRFTTTGGDNAISIDTPGLMARDYGKLLIRMQTQDGKGGMGQLFWARQGRETSEAASVSFRLQPGGQMHDYTLDLAANPLWRGEIASLRLDPTATENTEVRIEAIRLLPR